MNVKQPGTAFSELLKSLKDMDDDAVKLAAAEGNEGNEDDEDNEDNEDNEDGDDEGTPFGKSLGSNAEGDSLVDATDLVKSLMERADATDYTLTKALGSIVGAMGKQNDLIKSLQNEIKILGNQGRGRKTMVSVLDKPGTADTLSKSGAAGEAVTPSDLMAKCSAAYDAGKITGVQFSKVDVCLRNQWPIDADVLVKVAAHK